MFLKRVIKRFAPKLSLQLRTWKLLRNGVDPDMQFIADLPKHLLKSNETSHFVSYFGGQNTAIDVGACGGEYACIMARHFKKVVSVEPVREVVEKLRRSLPVNCEVLESAMGKCSGTVSLRIPKIGDARMHALSTVATHEFAFSDVDEVDAVNVNQITVDELVRVRNLRPYFIKIDVEGYEWDVLLGAVSTIESCRPMFLIEIEKRHNKNFKEIFSLLGSYGYRPFHLEDGELRRSSPERVDVSYDSLVERNVSGITEVIASRASWNYINNFLFLPSR